MNPTVENLKHATVEALRQQHFVEAEQWLAAALQLAPATPDLLFLLGTTLAQTGKADQAIQFLDAARAAQPNHVPTLNNLATVLRQQGRLEEAVVPLRHALLVQPKSADTLVNLGHALKALGRIDQARECAHLALKLKPDHIEALILAGVVLLEQGKPDDARRCFQRAAALKPDGAAALHGLGLAHAAQGELKAAAQDLVRAIALAPQQPAIHLSLAETLLAAGDYPDGSAEYEWRWQTAAGRLPELPAPLWDGNPLPPGQTLLLWCESGAAEAIQMIRFARDLHSFAERIVVTCPAPLMRLFRSCKDIDEVVPLGGELPFFDAHLPMGSLINRLGITVDRVTSDPYLAGDPARRELFAPFLAGPGFKVGLAWSADPGMRGPLLAELAGLLEIPGIRFFSLDTAAAELAASPFAGKMTDLSAGLADFADAATLIGELDLVIAADNAIAQLAGALGRPAWVMLPRQPHWRWARERSETPWYRSLLLYRQRGSDWSGVTQEIANALAIFGAGAAFAGETPTPVPATSASTAIDPRAVAFDPFFAGGGLKIGIALADEHPPVFELAALLAQPGARFFALDRAAVATIGASPFGSSIADVSFCETGGAAADNLLGHIDLVIATDGIVAARAGGLGIPTWVMLPADAVPSATSPTTYHFQQQPGESWSPVIAQIRAALAAGDRERATA